MAQNDVPINDGFYMGQFDMSRTSFCDTLEGRFVVSNTHKNISIFDLFHSKTTKLGVDYSSATIDGIPMEACKQHRIVQVYALDSYSMLVRFRCSSPDGSYMGVATLDLERPLMIVQQTISLSIDYGDSHSSFIPLSHSRSLHEGLILQPSMLKPFHYFLLKMERGNQLSATRINVPVKMRPFGCFNGVLYGLVDSVVGTTGGEELKVFDLAKLSLSNGEYVQKSTSNFELLKLPNHFYPFKIPNNMCCVGNKLFVYNTCLQENKMLSLDLVTLKWKSEMIPAKSVQLLGTDGKRSLIVFGGGNLIKPNVCRHVVNQPDKLIDLAWFQLKRIFDDRPSSYEFIARQLPYTFKRKNPFPHL